MRQRRAVDRPEHGVVDDDRRPFAVTAGQRLRDRARRVAEYLRAHPKIDNVWYLDFLPQGHLDRELHRRQNKSAGSTFSFEVKGGEAAAFALLDRLEVIKLAVSLGGTETLASHPASTTHSAMSPEELKRFSITPSLIRISIGVEDPEDLIADLEQALRAVPASP